jgi:hypothetical protein
VPGLTRVCEEALQGRVCTDCPNANDAYVVCPSAFWGFRYAIEQIPGWTDGSQRGWRPLLREIHNSRPLELSFNVWRNFLLWPDHLVKLKRAGDLTVRAAENIPELERVWQRHGSALDVIYFYCHGGDDGDAYIELSDNHRITTNFLEACHLNWPHNPLVFLNGCSTGDYGPSSYVSLIDDFRAAGACGVIGTECPVPEMFAEAYADGLFTRFFRQEPLGQSMLALRRELLLERKNPLGLAYSLYAAHEVALEQPVVQVG